MSEPYLAEVRIMGFNFAPRGYAFCDGQILPISQNQSLYSLLGTTYGGDGRTSFALPDLRGRIPFHESNTMYLGKKSGEEYQSLSTAELPVHSHTMNCVDSAGDSISPENNIPAQSALGDLQYASNPVSYSSGGATDSSGSSTSHYNLPPYLVLNFVIALTGLFPSRS